MNFYCSKHFFESYGLLLRESHCFSYEALILKLRCLSFYSVCMNESILFCNDFCVGSVTLLIDIRGLLKYFRFVLSPMDMPVKDDCEEALECVAKILPDDGYIFTMSDAGTSEVCNTEQTKSDSGTAKDSNAEDMKVEEVQEDVPEREFMVNPSGEGKVATTPIFKHHPGYTLQM